MMKINEILLLIRIRVSNWGGNTVDNGLARTCNESVVWKYNDNNRQLVLPFLFFLFFSIAITSCSKIVKLVL